MNNKLKITFNDMSVSEFDINTPVLEMAKFYQEKIINPIIGAKINNQVVDFNVKLNQDTTLNFFDINDLTGYKMYQAGLKFVMIVALREIYGSSAKVVFEHSIDKGIMCTITNGKPFDEAMSEELKKKMTEIIEEDLPIQKINVTKRDAIDFYNKVGEKEKAVNIQNLANQLVIFYKLKDSCNYFYMDMPYSTGVLAKFDIKYLEEGSFVLLFPSPRSNNEVPEYTHHQSIIDVFKKAKEWVKKMNVPYVSYFNQIVTEGKVEDFIRMNEIEMNNQLQETAKTILSKEKIKMILVAGPSSSGKTTTTKKLAMRLKAAGKKILMISVDDYFKERTETPRFENGDYDFESLAAIDIDLFNTQLKELLDGKSVTLPTFDFKLGKKLYTDEEVSIDKDTILIVEGLHCLNEEITTSIAREVKYKIYLSPFTPLSADRHNHLSTVDLRLIRRIVRDNRTRGWDVSQTIKSWQNVRLGEERYIFPHIREADEVLNTALIYELGVLKVYAEPILFSVSITSPYYEEARRLINFLKSFFPISSEYVPNDSILREFVGGSIYDE